MERYQRTEAKDEEAKGGEAKAGEAAEAKSCGGAKESGGDSDDDDILMETLAHLEDLLLDTVP